VTATQAAAPASAWNVPVEPAPGAWSIRRRGQAPTSKAFGPGEWVLDDDAGDLDPAPVTTIAWRLGHLHSGSRVGSRRSRKGG
jgi:hypothetical protein